MTHYDLVEQGSYRVEAVDLLTRKIGFRHYCITTDKKRPMTYVSYFGKFATPKGYSAHESLVVSLYGDDEADDKTTMVWLPLPRPLPGRQWVARGWTVRAGAEIVAWTEWKRS